MGILEFLIIGLIIFWVLGFSLHIAGGLIHVLLILAVVLVLARLLGINF